MAEETKPPKTQVFRRGAGIRQAGEPSFRKKAQAEKRQPVRAAKPKATARAPQPSREPRAPQPRPGSRPRPEGKGKGKGRKAAGPRDVALEVLLRVELHSAYLNLALDAALEALPSLDRRDAGLATELAYGVMRRRDTLDIALSPIAKRGLASIETPVLMALRLGAYQLLYLDRVPPHAAVSETIESLKRRGLERAAGFANAILRELARRPELKLPDEQVDPIGALAARESHPRWLVERWVSRMGLEEAKALCAADNAPPALSLRVNAHRTTREQVLAALATEGVEATPTGFSPLGLTLVPAGPLSALKVYREGLVQVQDEAAQLVGLLADAKPGMRVLDACAAPGGKACHLAEQLQGQGKVFAIDQHSRKLARLRAELRRLGQESVVAPLAADTRRSLPFREGGFDLVLLDAPCTGLGTLRRHPELRYRRAEADIARLAEEQQKLIESVAPWVKPGGALIYAVCSPEPEEGERSVETFLARHSEFARAPVPRVDGWAPPWHKLLARDGSLRTFPHRGGMDAFFAARLERKESP